MLQIIAQGKPFAFIRRQAQRKVLVLSGSVSERERLADIPRGEATAGAARFDTLSILPFRQVEELGFVANHGDEKILCLSIEEQREVPLDEMIAALPCEEITMEGEGAFTPDDAGFEAMTRRIIDEEIGNGEGCNFVVPRFYRGQIAAFSLRKALSIYRRLLENEYGAYWTFLYFTGEQYFIGATPERHLSCDASGVKMNPISGTLRKVDHTQESIFPALGSFLKDQKEIFELLMVVDEELKMMAEICSSGGQVVGPMIKEMAKLIHTEYVLAGQSDGDVVDMLRQSMFAATVVGSPIENACRINQRHGTTSRRYYGSALALLGHDAQGRETLDSPITIRMAEIAPDGTFEIGAGATIVRDSDPVSETAETAAKARGMLSVLGLAGSGSDPVYHLGEQVYGEDTMIQLAARNAKLSRFWIEDQSDTVHFDKTLAGKRVTIIDNEDNFTKMLAHMIRPLGMIPTIVPNAAYDPQKDTADMVVLGPGPGDPRDQSDPRIAKATALCRDFLAQKKPLLCICLGHQILCNVLGLPLAKKQRPFQGAQELIDFFGKPERVGFYNTFAGKMDGKERAGVEISFDAPTGEIHALRGPSFAGLQFHPESILTTNGMRIVHEVIRSI
ncbi:MAG: anthranilate synthase family protein [Alphaproteobacteria bacterium]|nr:anthranilate synthase family protein [Alphaproteobacteria bacterium]